MKRRLFNMLAAVSLVVTTIAAAAMGLTSVVLPVLIFRPRWHSSGLWPVVTTGVEEMSWLTLLLLLLSGLVIGCWSNMRPVVLGLLTMAGLPAVAVLDMIANPKSHNLFPFEFAIYAALSLIAAAGAYAAQGVRRAMRTTNISA